jgi:hypothetical protein
MLSTIRATLLPSLRISSARFYFEANLCSHHLSPLAQLLTVLFLIVSINDKNNLVEAESGPPPKQPSLIILRPQRVVGRGRDWQPKVRACLIH